MSTLSLRLPASLHQTLTELARADGVSMNQFITTAVAEKIAVLKTVDSLKERAARGDRRAFEAVLAKVPDAPPLLGDELGAREQARSSRRRSSRYGRESA